MCDTRTWVFKLFIVVLVVHNLAIQHGRAASISGPVAASADGAPADVGASPDDDDSLEATPPEEDTLPGSQKSTLNSTTHDNRRSSAFRSSLGSPLFDAADGYEAPGFDEDDDRTDEDEFNGRQRKFDDAAVRERDRPGESNAAPVYGVLRRVEEDADYEEDELSTVPPTTTTSVPGNVAISEDDDEDVDEILQPLLLPTDTRHYSARTDGRAMRPAAGYSTEHRATGDADVESRPSNSMASPVTNHMRPVYTSAFEQHKAHIRNSKGYGHRSHKKKYKDFLHYVAPTRQPLTTTTGLTPLQRGFLSRDKIFTSDDLPRYYQGQVNYYMSSDDDRNEDKDPRSNDNRHKHHHQHQHQSSGHLRSGGRFRHIGLQQKSAFPYTPTYPESNIMNYQHLGALAKQQHRLELERRYSEKEINEYSQHYHKYPHLTELEDQVLQYEQEDMLNGKGDGMFSNQGELVLAADDGDGAFGQEPEEDPNLPPYIKKYQRRNKQLLELLEGTKPPSTALPPSQWSSSVLKPGPIDGNSHHRSYPQRHHLRSHRKHHHNHQLRNRQRLHRHKSPKWQIEDLFEEQRANPNNPNRTTTTDSEMILPVPAIILGSGGASSSTTTTTTTTTVRPSTSTLSPFDELLKHDSEHLALLQNNQLPAEDVSISGELYDWAIEVGGGDDDDDNENDNPDSYIEHNRSGPSAWNRKPAISSTTLHPGLSARKPNVYGSIIKSPTSAAATSTAKPITSFAYHRVVEAPRVVGAGQTGRKQRLPFVAITDRRLETSKKSAYNAGSLARKDSEQNHFPMP